MSNRPILLIEDDESLGATLAENLALEGWTVDWIRDGKTGLDSARKNLHCMVVLDLMIPQLPGLEVLKELRRTSQIPVLIISAKGTSQDRITGLELRADDYLVKPFHLKEFLLRVQSILRRQNLRPGSELPTETFEIGRAIFDPNSLTMSIETTESSESDTLSEKEAKVLKLLISRANSVVSRNEILDLVWGFNAHPSPRTIDNVIVKLRKWIEVDPSHPEYIVSHRGLGYCLKFKLGDKL